MICELCHCYVPSLAEALEPEYVFESCLCGECYIKRMKGILGV